MGAPTSLNFPGVLEKLNGNPDIRILSEVGICNSVSILVDFACGSSWISDICLDIPVLRPSFRRLDSHNFAFLDLMALVNDFAFSCEF